MNIAITGGSGFVGKALSDAANDRKTCLSAVKRDSLNEWTIGEQQSCIIHLAARAHTGGTLEDFRRDNCEATKRLVEAAIPCGLQRFVYVSSIGVHGRVCKGGAINESSPINPQDNYAVAKYEAECALRALSAEHGFELVVLRPTIIYGPGAPGNWRQLEKLLRRGLNPFSRLRVNRRSVCSVDTLVAALLIAAEHPACAGKAYVVADAEPLSTAAMMAALAEGLQVRQWSLPIPRWFGSVMSGLGSRQASSVAGSLAVDPSALARDTGWQPVGTAQETLAGLRAMAAQWRDAGVSGQQ